MKPMAQERRESGTLTRAGTGACPYDTIDGNVISYAARLPQPLSLSASQMEVISSRPKGLRSIR